MSEEDEEEHGQNVIVFRCLVRITGRRKFHPNLPAAPRSDQIEAGGVTCGPRRPKVPVMGSQAHGGHSAAASRPGTLTYKFITTQ